MVVAFHSHTSDPPRSRRKSSSLASPNGLPAIAILDADGKLLTTKIPTELTEAGRYVPEKVTSFLQQWAAREDH